MLYKSLYEVIGNTPILEVKNNFYLKLEFLNLTGSIKDRSCYKMLMNLDLNDDSVIIEATSGNLGISLCVLAKKLGYKVVICMPDNVGIERIKLLKFLDAKIILTDSKLGMEGSIKVVDKLCKKFRNFVKLDQFNNKFNVLAHFDTAKEIIKDIPDVDYIVCGIGSGGTITGIAHYFKNYDVNIIGIEPSDSPFLTKNIKGEHKIIGIGAGFKPNILETDLIKEIVSVSFEDTFLGLKELIDLGILAGFSSGACYKIGYDLHKKYPDKKIVCILADGLFKYSSLL